jgi:IS30 family transposase
VNHNGGRTGYRAWRAQARADAQAARPKPGKLATHPRLAAVVTQGLEQNWSPAQISHRLIADYPEDEEMRVSPETIYQTLFVQTRGGLNRALVAHLRSGRTTRRPQSRAGKARPRGVIKDRVMLRERPAEADDRAVPGHWEGDLIMGSVVSNSAIATLVERTTRYVLLVHLGADHTAANVAKRLQEEIQRLPRHLFKSLTWDQGVEMAHHAQFSLDTKIRVYFCPPHSPWLRGTNENTNGLLRQYFPKGTDLTVHSQADLDRVAHELNNRPRQTLNWMKPSEQLTELMR